MNIKRCNLSGIYIFDKLEGDDKAFPTCIEDCNESVRGQWLSELDKEALINVINRLCYTLKDLSEEFGIMAGYETIGDC